jgi:hypothetical protein
VRELRALTPEEFARAERRLRNPAPGSRIAAAKEYGIDLTLLIENLRLTPAERAMRIHEATATAERVRGAAMRYNDFQVLLELEALAEAQEPE